MRIKSELDAVSDQGQILIKRYGNLSEFLIYDENITIVDEYICLNGDTETARNLALSQVMEKMQPFNESSQDQGDSQITNLTITRVILTITEDNFNNPKLNYKACPQSLTLILTFPDNNFDNPKWYF